MHSKKEFFDLGVARAKTEIIKTINDFEYPYTPYLEEMEKKNHAPAYVCAAIRELADEGFIKLKFDHEQQDYTFIKKKRAHIEIEYEDLEIEEPQSFFRCTIL